MIRSSVKGRTASVMGQESLFKSAVLVPLVERNGEIHVLFEERAHHLRRQPGEIGFPGGRIDPGDSSPQAAAIRETCEELGVLPTSIDLIGALDYVVTPFQIVYPFVGQIQGSDLISPSPDEVASVFYVPLHFLRENPPVLYHADLQVTPPEDFPFEQIPNGRNYKWKAGQIPEYFYYFEDRIIWGLTARILHHLLEITLERE